MKPVKKLLFIGALIVAPMLIPTQSKAGFISDLLKDIFGKKDTKKDNYPPPGGANSVPINGGVTLLLVAGLGLGTAIMYKKNKGHADQPVI